MTTRVLGAGLAFMPCRRPWIHRPIWSARVFVCNSLRCSAFMRLMLLPFLPSRGALPTGVVPDVARSKGILTDSLGCIDLGDDKMVPFGGQCERRLGRHRLHASTSPPCVPPTAAPAPRPI